MRGRLLLPATLIFLFLLLGFSLLQISGHPLPRPFSVRATPGTAVTVPFVKDGALTPRWAYGTVAGRPAWHDTKASRVWSAPIAFYGFLPADAQAAKAACAALIPEGAWSVPLLREFTLARIGGIAALGPAHTGHWLALTLSGAGEERVTSALMPPAPTPRLFRLRCIGYAR